MQRLLAAALSSTLFLGLLTPLAASCTQETVVLGTIQDTDSGSSSAQRCTDDCPIGLYCDKTSCSALAGTCLLSPIECPMTEDPYCGCDGVTYFNDCLRKANGIASSTNGECPLGANLCGGPSNVACPSGAVCAMLGGFLHGGPCPPQIPGTCWVLPAICPPPTTIDRWDSCIPGDGECLDTCTAIRMGGEYRRSEICGPDASR